MELKPPPALGKNPTKKALLAYQSELRRYAKVLETLDAKLTKKAELLDKKAELLEKMEKNKAKQWLHDMWSTPDDIEDDLDEGDEEELDCGCLIADAKAGCDCPDCDMWRDMQACRLKAIDRSFHDVCIAGEIKEVKTGDEVNFLEKLIKLKDDRK